MIDALQKLINIAQGIWEYLSGTIAFLGELLEAVPALLGIVLGVIGAMPIIILLLANIAIGIHIIKVILYGG